MTGMRRVPWLALVVGGSSLAVMAGCGGSTSRNPSEHSGGASSGGQSAGGSSGGSPASGGQATMGGQTGSGGGGASDICSLPQVSGRCSAHFPSFWHNPSTGQCESFVYGGCDGNANRFGTLAECQATCGVTKPSIDFCNTPADCVITSPGCCGACEPLAASDLISMNIQHAKERECNVLCGPCPSLEPEERTTRRYFMPGCVEHQCTLVDVRETDAVACQVDSDCRLRVGTDCCERCAGEPIAVNRSEAFSSLFCPAGVPPCPSCPTMIPSGASSACVSQRCVVNETPCTPERPCQ